MTRVFRASLVLALLSAACGEPAPATDPCTGLPPLTLTASPQRVRVKGPVSLTATGGSGYYRFRSEPGGSSGEMRGSRFIAGPTPATDTLVVEDLRCPGDARTEVSVEASFGVAPARAMLKPGTSFQVEVTGVLGEPVFTLESSAGSTLSPSGQYTAGSGQGLDLVRVRDSRSGDEAILQFEVRADAALHGEPAYLSLPAGSSLPLVAVGGSDRVLWTKLSGPGSVQGNRFTAEPGSQGAVMLEAADFFTGQKTTVFVRILDELTRETQAHGQVTDTASIVTADFDGDGVMDVAVGRPESDLTKPQGGVVLIFKGSTAGLPAQPTWVLTGETDTARFGDTLTAGDLDKDGKAELLVSSPGADVTVGDSGAVYLYRFGEKGPESLRRALTGLGRGSFGAGMALADVDGDGDLDLVAGSPSGDLAPTNSVSRRGVVDIFLLTPGQPVPDLSAIRLGGSDVGFSGALETRSSTELGRMLVVSDLNGDSLPDLAALSRVSRFKSDGSSDGMQQAVSVFFARAEGQRFRETPDVYVLPANTSDDDKNEGTWRLGVVPGEGTRPALLMAVADRADSPDLRTSGGLKAMTDSGGALLFDLSTYKPTGEPKTTPVQVKRDAAWARLYGDGDYIVAGRSWAVMDVDGKPGLELLLGAPYASATLAGKSQRYAGKVLFYSMAGLTRGVVTNKPATALTGVAKSDAFGAGLAAWPLPGSAGLVVFAGRASAPGMAYTGRVDGFVKAGDSISTWARTSVMVPARPGVERFGEAVAVAKGATGGVVALVGSPGFSGPGVYDDGADLNAGRAWTYGASGGASTLVAEGAGSPHYRGRNVGTDVAFTDFNGDGRADLVMGAPGLVIPKSTAGAEELANVYVTVYPECLPGPELQTGGVLVSLAQADGSYKPAYRLWGPADITGCTPEGSSACQRRNMGRGVVGGFDLNGDGLQDLGMLRNNGMEVFLGRAPEDASLTKLTMRCDPVYSSPVLVLPTSSGATPTLTQQTSALAAVGDLNGDGCGELAWRYSNTDGNHPRSGVAVLFGYDKSGKKCAGRTDPKLVRLAADPEVGMTSMGLGVATARVGRVLGKSGADYLAVSATNVPYDGVTQPAVLLFDTAKLKEGWFGTATKQAKDVLGAMELELVPRVLVHRSRAVGFGTALAGGVDVTGDGVPDLVVSAPGASVASDGGGAVFVYVGGPRSTGALTPLLTLTGDSTERGGFGQDLALLAGSSSYPPTLVIGAPLSYRTGTQNGTAFVVPLAF